jgi:BirA family biotin operon repressor/biotin-[acetyl-CoA-carboxylase] ligase
LLIEAPLLSRQERFRSVGSTNDVVRGWLAAGAPEVCLAVADEQTAGRGREGRPWQAPAGRALLLSLGFRPTWLAAHHAWRLAAVASLAMADAAEEVAGLRDRTIRLKWPNDLVIEDGGASATERVVRKVAGVLGETEGLGTDDPRVVVGIGVNGDWPADEFPPELAPGMTSLREASGGRPIDRALLLDAFLGRLEPRTLALRDGRFDSADWLDRQLTNRRLVRLVRSGGPDEVVRAVGVDPDSGGLLVEDPTAPMSERLVLSGEIHHLRLASDAV